MQKTELREGQQNQDIDRGRKTYTVECIMDYYKGELACILACLNGKFIPVEFPSTPLRHHQIPPNYRFTWIIRDGDSDEIKAEDIIPSPGCAEYWQKYMDGK